MLTVKFIVLKMYLIKLNQVNSALFKFSTINLNQIKMIYLD